MGSPWIVLLLEPLSFLFASRTPVRFLVSNISPFFKGKFYFFKFLFSSLLFIYTPSRSVGDRFVNSNQITISVDLDLKIYILQ